MNRAGIVFHISDNLGYRCRSLVRGFDRQQRRIRPTLEGTPVNPAIKFSDYAVRSPWLISVDSHQTRWTSLDTKVKTKMRESYSVVIYMCMDQSAHTTLHQKVNKNSVNGLESEFISHCDWLMSSHTEKLPDLTHHFFFVERPSPLR